MCTQSSIKYKHTHTRTHNHWHTQHTSRRGLYVLGNKKLTGEWPILECISVVAFEVSLPQHIVSICYTMKMYISTYWCSSNVCMWVYSRSSELGVMYGGFHSMCMHELSSTLNLQQIFASTHHSKWDAKKRERKRKKKINKKEDTNARSLLITNRFNF